MYTFPCKLQGLLGHKDPTVQVVEIYWPNQSGWSSELGKHGYVVQAVHFMVGGKTLFPLPCNRDPVR